MADKVEKARLGLSLHAFESVLSELGLVLWPKNMRALYLSFSNNSGNL